MKNNYLYQGIVVGSDGNGDFNYCRGNVVEELSTGRTFIIDLAKVTDETQWKDIAVEVYPKSITPLVVEHPPLKLDKGFYVLGNTLVISADKERIKEVGATIGHTIEMLEKLTDMKVLVLPKEL